jgi:glucose-6-phosphate isomerase
MSQITYRPEPARQYVSDKAWDELVPQLTAARDEIFADLKLLQQGAIPPEKDPLDAGFIDLPQRLLTSESGLLSEIETAAAKFREQVDRMLVLGIGGSYMGLRALFEALCHPYHNELPRELRGNAPRLSFEGENVDNDAQRGLLELLALSKNPRELADRWGIVVISKSGGTLETAVAFRIFRDALEAFYGPASPEATSLVIPVTGETGRLRSLSQQRGYPTTFPIPDGVGGRFSVLTAVGLFPAAVLGMDIRALLQGAADITERLRTGQPGSDPVLDYVGISHLLERDLGLDIRILSTWGKGLEAVGLWYDQLLAESLGKHERGAMPLTLVNTRDLHSRGQQHQEGKRDKLITNLIVGEPRTAPLTVPAVAAALDQDQLNRLSGKPVPALLAAAIQGTNEAYAEDRRPTADLYLPRKDAYYLGQLLQMFMLATAVEGRLIGINPYGQPGVEGYKKNMGRILFG